MLDQLSHFLDSLLGTGKKPMTDEERLKYLKNLADETEKRAKNAEDEAKLRERILTARQRIVAVKGQTGATQQQKFKMYALIGGMGLIGIFLLKGCMGC